MTQEHTVTIGKLLNSQQALNQLLGMQVPSVIHFKASQILHRIEDHPDVKAFNDEKNRLVKEYGEADEETGQPRVLRPQDVDKQKQPKRFQTVKTNFEAFQEEVKERQEEEVTITAPALPVEPLLYKTNENGDRVERELEQGFVFYFLDWLLEDGDATPENVKEMPKQKKKE